MGLAATPQDLLSLWSSSALLQHKMDTLRDLQRHLDTCIWASVSHSQFVFQGEEFLTGATAKIISLHGAVQEPFSKA